MRIRLAFSDDDTTPDQMPTMIAAVDEYTEDEWGGIPDFYKEDIAKYKNVREVAIHVSDDAVRKLFSVPTIAAEVES